MTVPVWEAPFLKALERCGVASEAARLARTGARNAFKRRKGNATFAAAWDAAVALHRSEAGRRALSAVHGERAPPPSCGRSPSPSKLGEDLASRQVVGGAKLERAGQSRWSKRAEETFLAELTVSANVRIAAAAAGFSAAAAYKRRLKDRHLAAAWDAAVEIGKARVHSYLVEATTRTFDPDQLPIGDERDIPKVSISEAINIAKLPARQGIAGPVPDREAPEPYDMEAVRRRIEAKMDALGRQHEREMTELGWRKHEIPVPRRGEGGELDTVWLPPNYRLVRDEEAGGGERAVTE